MRCGDAHRPESRDRSKAGRNNRHFTERFHDRIPSRIRRDVGASHALEHFDAAASARAVDEADDGQSEADGQLFAVSHLVADGGVGYKEVGGGGPIPPALAELRECRKL